MGVGAGLYMYVVVVQKFTFAISSPDEFLYLLGLVIFMLYIFFSLLVCVLLLLSDFNMLDCAVSLGLFVTC